MRHIVAFVAGLFSCALAVAQPADRLFESEALRLRLSLPDSWVLLPDIHGLVPDATVGAVDERGTYGIVIAEAIGEIDLEEYARLLVDQVAAQGPSERLAWERVEEFGREAFRYRTRAEIQGVAFQFENTIYRNGSHLFQVLCWAPDAAAGDGFCLPFRRALSVLPGEVVTPRAPLRAQVDLAGPGWSLIRGVYRNEIMEIAVEPPSGWRFAVGAELLTLNQDATVGMVHYDPDAYLVVISERVPAAHLAALEEVAEAQMAMTMRRRRGRLPVEVFGRRHRLRRYDSETLPIEIWFTTVARDEWLFQIQGWSADTGEKARDAIRQAVSSIRPLRPEDEIVSLDKIPRQEVAGIGEQFALRRGVYRDFELGYEWRVPAGFWQLEAPTPEARAAGEPIAASNLALGLELLLWPEPLDGRSLDELYDEELVYFQDDEPPAPERLEADAGPALLSPVVPGLFSEVPLASRLLVVGIGELGISIELSGFPEYLAAAEEETAVLASSIRPMPAHDMWRYDDGTYIDRRLGFSLRPPAGWRFANVTPEAMRPIGTVVEWLSGERDVAACALWTGTDSDGTARVEQVLDLQIRKIFDAAEMADPERHAVQLAGRPAQKLVWVGDTTVVEAIILSDGPWTYWLIGSWLGNESARWFRDAVESFALVE